MCRVQCHESAECFGQSQLIGSAGDFYEARMLQEGKLGQ